MFFVSFCAVAIFGTLSVFALAMLYYIRFFELAGIVVRFVRDRFVTTPRRVFAVRLAAGLAVIAVIGWGTQHVRFVAKCQLMYVCQDKGS